MKVPQQRLTRYLHVLSFDGLSTLDFPYISTLPNFQRFLQRAAYAKKVISVYPTLTYPAHVTIMTGKYPKNHGVVNNTILQPYRKSPDWYWQSCRIAGKPLFELATDTGMKVAALLWPVTAGAGIQYNLPEIFPNRPWQNQVLVSLLNGSPLYQLTLNYKYGKVRQGLKQPYLDDFVHQSLLYTVRRKKPDLTLAHYTDLDSMRHYHGVHSPEAREALHRLDRRLGEFLQTLIDAGIYNESTVVVLGDHGHIDVKKVIKLNVLLREHGYIEQDAQGRTVNYQAIAKTCDGSTYIYPRPQEHTQTLKGRDRQAQRPRGAGRERRTPGVLSRQEQLSVDQEMLQKLKDLLMAFNEEYHCFEAIYSQAEAAALGADPNCAFMVEGKRGYSFLDSLEGEVLATVRPEQVGVVPHYTKATHGYSPFKENYTTVFLAAGQGIKEGVILNQMNLVDEGPTLARLLGLSLEKADGRCLDEILRAPSESKN